MQERNGHIRFSPSDLNAFLECEHLTQLELAVERDPAPEDKHRNLPAADCRDADRGRRLDRRAGPV
jgi:hypothetical protein